MKILKTRCVGCGSEFNPLDSELQKSDHRTNSFCSFQCARRDWANSHLPHSFRTTDLARLKCQAQVAAVRGWVSGIDGYREQQRSLLLHGAISGSGKTRMAAWAIMELAASDWPGYTEETKEVKDGAHPTALWLSTHTFRDRYATVFRDYEARRDWEQDLACCLYLALDDVDKVKPTEGCVELLFSVLDARLTDGRVTILTTNHNGDSLAQRWGEDCGPYLVRRLGDYCLCVDFDVTVAANVVPMEAKTA